MSSNSLSQLVHVVVLSAFEFVSDERCPVDLLILNLFPLIWQPSVTIVRCNYVLYLVTHIIHGTIKSVT